MSCDASWSGTHMSYTLCLLCSIATHDGVLNDFSLIIFCNMIHFPYNMIHLKNNLLLLWYKFIYSCSFLACYLAIRGSEIHRKALITIYMSSVNSRKVFLRMDGNCFFCKIELILFAFFHLVVAVERQMRHQKVLEVFGEK